MFWGSIENSGEAGSGKFETRKILVRQLCHLSRSTKKKSRVHSGAQKTENILEAFGGAQLALGRPSTRICKYSEYQFDKDGKMIGVKVITHLLERSRIVALNTDERNFNVLYYLLASASSEEIVDWHLGDLSSFSYLNKSKTFKTVTSEDGTKAAELKDNMKSLGIGRRQQSQIFQTLAALLHLGNMEFVDDPTKPQEPCTIKNKNLLDLVAGLLGVTSDNLEQTLTYKTKLIRKELCTVFLDAAGSNEQRNSLAKTLYFVVFNWIIEHINERLCKDDDSATFIGMLEMADPTRGKAHYFEQFLTNYANDRLHGFLNSAIFDYPQNELTTDGLDVSRGNPQNPSLILDLFDSSSSGILNLLAQESSKPSVRKPDANWIERILESNGKNSLFIFNKKANFSIKHYEGLVEYDAKGFVEANRDDISPDFVTLMTGSGESMPSSNAFIRGLFSKSIIQTESNSKKGEMGAMVAASSRLLRKPSTKKAVSQPSTAEKKRISNTLAAKLTENLEDLFGTLMDTVPWVVYCIRPNDEFTPGKFDPKVVKSQLKNLDILELAKAKYIEYPTNYSFEEFERKYFSILATMNLDDSRLPRQKCEAFLTLSQWPIRDCELGKQKIHLSEPAWNVLDDCLRGIELQNPSNLSTIGLAAPRVSTDRQSERSLQADSSSTLFLGALQGDGKRRLGGSEDAESYYDDNESHYDSEYGGGGGGGDRRFSYNSSMNTKDIEMKKLGASGLTMDTVVTPDYIIEEEKSTSSARRKWVCCTWLLTWWIPSFCLSCNGMKRKDIQMAWREKVIYHSSSDLFIFVFNSYDTFPYHKYH